MRLARFLATLTMFGGISLSAPISAAAPNGHAAEDDDRQSVSLPAPMHAHMRDHLEAMGEIQAALADEDFATAADVAEARLGMSSMDDHDASRMARFMPATGRSSRTDAVSEKPSRQGGRHT